MASSRVGSYPWRLNLIYSQRRYLRSSDFILESQLRQLIAVLTILPFSPLTAKGVDKLTNGSHGQTNTGLKFTIDFGDGSPFSTLDVKYPKFLKVIFLFAGASINQDVLVLNQDSIVALSGRYGVNLFDSAPTWVRSREFQLKHFAGELNSQLMTKKEATCW